MNLPTILIGLVVAAAFSAAIVRMVRKKKAGGGCNCGCDNCPGAGLCHPENK